MATNQVRRRLQVNRSKTGTSPLISRNHTFSPGTCEKVHFSWGLTHLCTTCKTGHWTFICISLAMFSPSCLTSRCLFCTETAKLTRQVHQCQHRSCSQSQKYPEQKLQEVKKKKGYFFVLFCLFGHTFSYFLLSAALTDIFLVYISHRVQTIKQPSKTA